MKTIFAALAGLVALTAGGAAFAAPYGSGVDVKEARIAERIEHGVRGGGLTRYEARSLRSELRDIERLEARYSRGGFTRWEVSDLDRRLDDLSARVRFNRHDGERRPYR